MEDAIHTGVDDPALSLAQRWAGIRDVRARITGLECDAVRSRILPHNSKAWLGNNDIVSKALRGIGTGDAVKFMSKQRSIRAE